MRAKAEGRRAGPRVVLVSPVPPPHGGIATWTQIILDEGFCANYVPIVVDSKVSSSRGSFEQAPSLFDELTRGLRVAFRVAFQIVRQRPALVHVNSSVSPKGMRRDLLIAAIARALRKPVVVQYHGCFPSDAGARPVVRALVRVASSNLVLGERFMEDLRCSGGSPADRVLPNFIEDVLLARPRRERGGRSMRSVYVGSLIPAKGSEELVQIALRMPDLHFSAFGVLPAAGRGISAPPNLRLEGARPRTEVLAALEEADALLFPSHGEGFPYAVLEAMAARLPVVATRVGAIPDMIDEGRGGFLFAPRDVEGPCNALSSLAADPDLRARMGDYNRARVEQEFSRARVMEKLARLYDELLATSR